MSFAVSNRLSWRADFNDRMYELLSATPNGMTDEEIDRFYEAWEPFKNELAELGEYLDQQASELQTA